MKDALKKRGYEVVSAETYKYPIDAIVYEGSSFPISYITTSNMPGLNSEERANYGVLMVNALGKSVEEIDFILKNRYYSPLF